MGAMRWNLLCLLCWSAVAVAQPAAPAPAPAPRVRLARPTGPSLAAGRDDDFDAPPPGPAPTDRVVQADDATLLRAILWAFEPAPREIRVQAVEDLGLLGDTRALNALAHFVQDADPAVQVAAVRAIRLLRHPRAEEILVNAVKHPSLPERVKLFAIEGLLFQNTRSALLFLWSVGNNPAWGAGVYGTARRMLLDVPQDTWRQPT